MTPTLISPILPETRSLADISLPENDFSFEDSSRGAEIELSLWLEALVSFLETENQPAERNNERNNSARDWTSELRLLAWALLKCSQLALSVRVSPKINQNAGADLRKVLQESFALCESLATQSKVESTAWTAWCEVLKNELEKSEGFPVLQEQYRQARQGALLPALEFLQHHPQLQGIFGADVREIFGRLCGLLERLQLIEKMLKGDEPLKPALLLFALLQKETRGLLRQSERVLKILPPGTAFHEILDGTIYIVPLELRKVYGHELVGVSAMRQAPAIFARVENACGLLKDCFQQAIIALAQVFAPELQAADVFSNQQDKLEQSLALRSELRTLLRQARQAEKTLEPTLLANLNERLANFRQNTMPFLMFKDIETTERFIEEIARTKRNAEIAQVLHRFGAYLETLLGQVNMRNVLANYPFDYSETNF